RGDAPRGKDPIRFMNQRPQRRLWLDLTESVADSRRMRRCILALALTIAICTAGCGYSTAGKATHIPANIQTIFIPAFVNQTHTYKIEQIVTTQVVREFIARTKYKVVSDPAADSDATLKGTVLSAEVVPMTYDSQSGRAS